MTNNVDAQYLRILRKLLDEGVYREGRNGGTFGLFGEQMRFDLNEGFPLLTTKKVHTRSIIVELLWFLRGESNAKWMEDQGVNIWREWGNPDTREMGPIYPIQWRAWQTNYYEHDGAKFVPMIADQITNVIQSLRTDPYSRRHVVSAWNVGELDHMALPPCHCLFQFHVANGKLSCHLYQRSADWFLGVPFNIASYALLTHLIAREVGLGVGDLVMSFGDLHLYANHVEQAKEQISREPFDTLPILSLEDWYHEDGPVTIFEIEPRDINVFFYESHPAIKAEVSK